MSEAATPDASIQPYVEILSGSPDGRSLARIRNDKADDKIRDHIRMTPGVQPFKHNYYTADQFLST